MSDKNEEFMNVETYIGLCQKYPEARKDLLNLRRQKNKALYILITVFCLFGSGIGYMIGKW